MTWERSTLGDIASWSSGGTPSAGTASFYGGDIPWLIIGDLNDGAIATASKTITDEGLANSSAKWVPQDAVLVAMYGSIGKLGLTQFPVTTNQAIAAAVGNGRVIPKFLFYYLLSQRASLAAAGKGATQKNIGQGTLKAWPISFPSSLDEQRRIVELVEEHLSHLDAADAALKGAQNKARALGSAALEQLVSESSENSPLVMLGDLASISSGTTPSRGNKAFWTDGSIPWITSGDLWAEDITEARQWVTSAALESTPLRMLPSGTLLVAMYGEGKTRGTVAELQISATINQACAAVQVSDPALRSWVRLILQANYSTMRKLAVGGVQPNLNQGLIRQIPIPLPEPQVRRAILARADVLRTGATRLRAQIGKTEARSTNLGRAVLAAAFSGRLTGHKSDTEVIKELAEVVP
ncbi:restriction endonuclease subunit S [Luteococcus sp. Sow4_B9]|uniref:restriction endonuclease subunit S n=1 Tax=Luteococcus sp. Sow4_B9 TaxID=3438792 RepID=UPI003F9A8E54